MTCLQILQEQQALLLEASPAYLAALSQDDKASCLNTAADAHDWELSHGQGTSSTALVDRAAEDAQGAGMRYSRCRLPSIQIGQLMSVYLVQQ